MTQATKTSIPISLPSMGDDEFQAMKESILSGWVTQGPKVRAFEEAFGVLHNTQFNLATTSCTTALHVILKALEIGPGDEVIVPAFTWVATANVVEHCGATPVFIDISLESFNLDVSQLSAKITPNTKAIIAVHLFGLTADMAAIKAIAGNIPVIEDAACAAGSASPEGPAGSLGIAGAFSFHPRKSVTTGEGGMVTTNIAELAKTMDILRNHGASISEEKRHHSGKPYILPDFEHCGFNYRMTDLQASVGIVQLQKLESFIAYRDKWASVYTDSLSKISWLQTPKVPEGYKHGWQSYVTVVDESKSPLKRNDIMEELQAQGISTRPGTHAVHMLGYYKDKYRLSADDFPNAFTADQTSMAIPLHNRMSDDDFQTVISALTSL